MLQKPFYDPEKTYQQNFSDGPFGLFAEVLENPQSEHIVQRSGEPSEQFLGHQVYQPFGIPAGPLINGTYVRAALRLGFDLGVYKTVRSREYPCHAFPNVLGVQLDGDLTLKKAQQPLQAYAKYTEPLSITNSFGVPSMNPDWWQEDLSQTVEAAGIGQMVIGSFQGTKPESGSIEDFVQDHVTTAKLVQETGVPAMIMNLSCPNEGTSNLLCFDVERVEQIAFAVKEAIGDTPLLLKLAYFEDDRVLRDLITRVGNKVQGLVAINTIPAPVVNAEGNEALPGRQVSGVCGAAIGWAGLDMVQRLVALRQEFDHDWSVVGVGGVTSAEGYQRYRDHGADAVLSATGAMWNPLLAQEVGQAHGVYGV